MTQGLFGKQAAEAMTYEYDRLCADIMGFQVGQKLRRSIRYPAHMPRLGCALARLAWGGSTLWGAPDSGLGRRSAASAGGWTRAARRGRVRLTGVPRVADLGKSGCGAGERLGEERQRDGVA